jgi:hypothetical protein
MPRPLFLTDDDPEGAGEASSIPLLTPDEE